MDGQDPPSVEGVAFKGFSRVSPFVRAEPSDDYLARHYGIVSSMASAVLSPQETAVSDDLGVALALVDKHRNLWFALLPSRPAERAADALSAVRSTMTALIDALRTHSVLRMCAILYGRNMASLADAFLAPTPSYESEPAQALRTCVETDQALFKRHLAQAITGIRRLWIAHGEHQLHNEEDRQDREDAVALPLST
nr:hypothetical protein [Pandoravirus aubagnensis]